MECWKAKQCSKEVKESCPAYQTGNTTELRCRRFAPLDRIFEGALSDGDGRMMGKPGIKCFSCPVFLSRRRSAGAQSCGEIASPLGSGGNE